MTDETSTIVLTPTGAISAALSIVAEQAPEGWWRNSTLLSGIGVAYELDKAGWQVVPKADSLDAAWAEAEAARPEGVGLTDLRMRRREPYNWRAFATNGVAGDGPTPAAALRALAAQMRETK